MGKIVLQVGETCRGKTQFPINECPNMKPVEGDLSMEFEHYECKVCGAKDKLDYEEMK